MSFFLSKLPRVPSAEKARYSPFESHRVGGGVFDENGLYLALHPISSLGRPWPYPLAFPSFSLSS